MHPTPPYNPYIRTSEGPCWVRPVVHLTKHSASHNGQPFLLEDQQQDIKVLDTHPGFSYQDSHAIMETMLHCRAQSSDTRPSAESTMTLEGCATGDMLQICCRKQLRPKLSGSYQATPSLLCFHEGCGHYGLLGLITCNLHHAYPA